MAIQSWVTTFAGLTSRLPQLVVEKYQRPYSWKKEQIERLFEEHFNPLVDGTDNTHLGDPFVGTVVVMPAGKGAFEIIDGQQRCSTMTMIYAEAYRSLRDAGGKFEHGHAARFLCPDNGDPWIRMKTEDDTMYRILTLPAGTRLDIDDFCLQELNRLMEVSGRRELGAITRVRDVIVKEIEDYVDLASNKSKIGRVEALVCMLRAIRDSLKVVAVEVDGHGQGLAVFESLNTVGLPLTLEQLIRNCLMKAFNDPKSHNVIDQFWDGSGAGGKSFHNSIAKPEHRTEFLLQYYVAFHGPITSASAYNQFKRLANEVKAGRHFGSLKEWLLHMQSSWSFYAKYKGPLRSLGGKVVYPMLLLANQLPWNNEDVRGEAINRVAFAVEAALLRTQVCSEGLTPLTTASSDLCRRIRTDNFPLRKPCDLEAFIRSHLVKVVPDDVVFADAIENMPAKYDSRRTQMMLRRFNYAISVGLSNIHENIGMNDSFDGEVVQAIVPKDYPKDSELNSLGFKEYSDYQRLTKSLANAIISPSGGVAAKVPANCGISTNTVSSSLLKKRATTLAKLAVNIWKMEA
jgi:hypothetical protein